MTSSILEDIEAEVQRQANNMPVEIVLLLLEKWDRDRESDILLNEATLPELLHHYVRMKIALHHIRKAWDRGWSSMSEDVYFERSSFWTKKIKQARRDYYVAKLRYETDHGIGCTCRGCQCVTRING